MILYITCISTTIPIFVALQYLDLKIIMFKVNQEVFLVARVDALGLGGGGWRLVKHIVCKFWLVLVL